MSCTAQTSVPNSSYPTSSDCPPDPGYVTTRAATAEAKASGGQARVSCGYCRDGDGGLSFTNPPLEPTFLSILDTTADLPGPGVTGLEGSIQLQ